MLFKKLINILKKDYLWLRIIVGLIILGSFFCFARVKIDADMYWHIRLGEQTLRTHEVPKIDTFTYSMPGHDWVDHEWLPEIGIYWLWSHNLWMAAIILCTLITFIPFAIYLGRYKSLPVVLVIALAGYVATFYLSPRPQVFSFLFFFILLEILISVYVKKSKSYKALFFIPVIFFLWANTHAGFFSGLAVFALFIAGSFASSVKNFFKRPEYKWGMAILVLSAMVVLINPYGPRLYEEVFSVAFTSNVNRYIGEWTTPLFTGNMEFAFFIGIFAAIILIYRKKLPLPLVFASTALGLFFLKSGKIGIFFIYTAIPALAMGLGIIEKEARFVRPNKTFSRKEKIFGWVAFAIALTVVSATMIIASSATKPMYVPEEIASYINRQIDSGEKLVVFNNYNWGGYFIYKIPRLKIFIDGRMPHWRDQSGYSAMDEFVDVFFKKDVSRWKEVFDKWQVNEAVFQRKTPQPQGKMANFFINDLHFIKKSFDLEQALTAAGWKTVYQDGHGLIMKKP